MHVRRFTSEYEEIAWLYGENAAAMRMREEARDTPVIRWIARDEGEVTGAVVAWLRPDNRMFLTFKVRDVDSYGPLVAAAASELGRSLSTSVNPELVGPYAALIDAGFETETVGERFRVPFADAMRVVRRAWVPSGYRIASVVDLDEGRVFELDNAIRNLVPGTDGWAGDPTWFHAELESEAFDKDAYLVAVEEATDRYGGLIRIWRNPAGPHLGLIGVLPDHRVQPLAAALLKQGLAAAADWGFDAVYADTSPSNAHTYPRLERLGAERIGGFVQMTRA
ncbi:MAG: GNAT family N-acetyltransferase [Acidimicrobiia bacterium]